jgi:hypothetical protein
MSEAQPNWQVEGFSPERPTLNAMLICDASIREEGTGKISLIGIFANIRGYRFPIRHPVLNVYANLGDAQGKYRFRLDLVRLKDGRTLGSGSMDMEVGDRHRPTEVVFELVGLVFDQPGRYQFEFWANAWNIGFKSFTVLQLNNAGGA